MAKKIAFQGSLGAYAHLACTSACSGYEVVPCTSFASTLQVVEDGKADLAMIPVENSNAGRVTDIHRLLPKTTLRIIAEHFQPIHHCLLGIHGAEISQIKEARSYIQALIQCEEYLNNLSITPISWSDTATSAKDIAKLGDKTVAAIASSIAADIYDLNIIAENIEDQKGNTTRFLIFAREGGVEPINEMIPCITTLLFKVRNVPAALYKALGGFATSGLNMLKLESYMGEDFCTTCFYVDVLGHPSSPEFKHALDELNFFSDEIKILGVYPVSPERKL